MRKLIILFTFLLSGLYLSAQDNINSVILSLPNDVVYGLDASQKDLLIAAGTSDTAAVTISSNLYSSIRRTAISDSYISLQTSGAGTTQVKLLPLVNNSKIICVVKTVCGDFCDSLIRFYTTDWKPIDGSDLFPKMTIDWFIKEDADRNSDDYRNAVAVLDMNPMKISLSPNSDIATVEYNIKRYLSEGDYELLEPFLKDEPKVLVWDKVSFKAE
jgi:hypothetical protein